MGVPAFFRWLCMRCPKILVDGLEPSLFEEATSEEFPKSAIDIDNLYLDMNGLIHPCTHPENLAIPKPLTESEMFSNIFLYIDKILSIVQPRNILYLAIDGVAPRAKMNQQRSRRFRSALETKRQQEKKLLLREIWRKKGIETSENIESFIQNSFDSNVITPGTEFMSRLSKALHGYINSRINNNPLWKNLKVFFSDANVPGEGEHKILDFIRQQRALPNYNPNTSHCLYGADADLLMLGLSTHEPHFYIFRETIMTANDKKCTMCGQQGHFFFECQGEAREKDDEIKKADVKEISVKFQYVRLSIMREYLDLEFKIMNLPFGYNLERVIDDFVFMCFFVGNDFIPHLPTLDIRAGGIDCLLYIYKRILPFLKGYLTENGEINLMRADVFLQEVGSIEEIILKNNVRREEYYKNMQERKNNHNEDQKKFLENNKFSEKNIIKEKIKFSDNNFKNRKAAIQMKEELESLVQESNFENNNNNNSNININISNNNEMTIEEGLTPNDPKNMYDNEIDLIKKSKVAYEEVLIDSSKYFDRFMEGVSLTNNTLVTNDVPETMKDDDYYMKEEEKKGEKIPNNENISKENNQEEIDKLFFEELKKMNEEEKLKETQNEEQTTALDKILWGEIGFKERYYTEKFKISPQDFPEFKAQIQQAYVEALCWNFAYYYKGCISWKWFYPYHYSPFASDLEGIDLIKIRFESGEPLKPLHQLLAVLSPLSSNALPSCLRFLMLDPTSEIIDFYPEDFIVDIKGKKFAWMGEVLLPFIEEERLMKAITKYESLLNEEEQDRNKRGNTLLFVSKENEFKNSLVEKIAEDNKNDGGIAHGRITINYEQFGIGGFLIDINNFKTKKNEENQNYYVYVSPPNKRHDTNLLEGVTLPAKELDEELMAKIDRKFYAGNQTIRMLERALGSANDTNEIFNKGGSNRNELINRGHFNNNYAHNDFNNYFNNNRAVAREPMHYKNPQVLNAWANKNNGRPDNNIFNTLNQMNNRNFHNRNMNMNQFQPNFQHQQPFIKRQRPAYDEMNNFEPNLRKKKF